MSSNIVKSVASALSLSATIVVGWNQDSHTAGARLTQSFMNQDDVDLLLAKHGDLAAFIAWPDANHRPTEIIGQPDRYGWSMPSHFVNFPPGESYDSKTSLATKDANGRMAPNAINSMVHFREKALYYKDFDKIDYISDNMKTLDKALYETSPLLPNMADPLMLRRPVADRFRRESVFSVAHYFQDIHNPFHCADAADMGGFRHTKKCAFCNNGKQSNIHTIWDADMFDYDLRKEFGDEYIDQMDGFEFGRQKFQDKFYSILQNKYNALEKEDSKKVEQWKQECSGDFLECIELVGKETREFYLQNQGSLYDGEKDSTVDETYLDKYKEVAYEQVIKSSVRLASLLTRMAEELRGTKGEMPKSAPMDASEASSSQLRSRSRSKSPVKK
ncbi:hypothetical protein FOL47_003706 [Perkinsus chesapeaki]|uniref:Uncharacterized protein n=1 Tax=Perkinsus chesapeaki TaxID=330153 RepID=A0A7J6M6I7_PERCH|nr:hypothetical protein FOL47_003706 [Perkinsus chesapeaki]